MESNITLYYFIFNKPFIYESVFVLSYGYIYTVENEWTG